MATNTVLVTGHASKLIRRQEIAEGKLAFLCRTKISYTKGWMPRARA
jgi:hypothetical protein